MVGEALAELSPRFSRLYAKRGRPSIAPEKLLRALLLQVLYTIRSERQLMEQLDYNLLFRWFVGLNMDDPMWDVTVFTKNGELLLKGNIAQAFLQKVLEQARKWITTKAAVRRWIENSSTEDTQARAIERGDRDALTAALNSGKARIRSNT